MLGSVIVERWQSFNLFHCRATIIAVFNYTVTYGGHLIVQFQVPVPKCEVKRSLELKCLATRLHLKHKLQKTSVQIKCMFTMKHLKEHHEKAFPSLGKVWDRSRAHPKTWAKLFSQQAGDVAILSCSIYTGVVHWVQLSGRCLEFYSSSPGTAAISGNVDNILNP